jgi:hypothetical protein
MADKAGKVRVEQGAKRVRAYLPLPESQKIAGLACLYNEKVDL